VGIQLQFTERDWERIERDWAAWWTGELERPLVIIETIDQFDVWASDFPPETPVDEVLDRFQACLEAARFYGDAWPKWWPNFGPGIVAGFLGAQVHCVPGTVWFSPYPDREPATIEDIHPVYDADNAWWRRVVELTRAAVARWGDRVCVGFTDLGGNLDILASLRGTQELLLDLHDAPGDVERLSGEITRLWLRYYDELDGIIRQGSRGMTPWAGIWSPGRCYMLQSDFAYMISPRMFERFVLPDLAACCEALDYAFYHLDGKGQIIHLDMLLSLERLRGIQWIPGDGQPPPEEWLPLLRRIRDGGKLCQLYVSPEGARTIVRELGGRGFALYVTDQLPPDEAQDFLRSLAAEDAST
jgi:5-methyltetrahydrofolate--homocysteine methyltransferase